MSDLKIEEYCLAEDNELRFESAEGDGVVIELIEGLAELFGTELVPNKRYTFPPGSRAAIFSWQGCKIEVVGKTEGAYVAKHTPMVIYLNTHAALEQMREQCAKDNSKGPKLMVVGPQDVGKSTVCRILLNYAARLGRTPIFVDLDVGQGQVSIPGTIGSLYVEKPADPVDGFNKRAPLVFHFGHLSPAENMPLYNIIVTKMAQYVNQKLEKCDKANAGGVIINTCGWTKGDGYACLQHAAEAFEIDVVLVIDHERLYNEMQKDLPPFVKIVHEPKSGGVEERSRHQRIASRASRIREYFYGTRKSPIYPHSFEVKFDEVEVYKIGAPNLPDSCMPLGMKSEDTRTRLVKMQPSNDILHHVLAVSLASTPDHTLITTNVAGFVVVTDVNFEKESYSLLSPQPYPLPRRILLFSEVTFMDD